MTRFARARGSKSSNKREPEEASSWSQLKDGLLKRSDTITAVDKAQEIQKCKDTIKELQQKGSTTWSTFDEENRGETNSVDNKVSKKKNKTEKGNKSADTMSNNEVNVSKKRKMSSTDNINDVIGEKKGKKKKNKDTEEETNSPTGFLNDNVEKEQNISMIGKEEKLDTHSKSMKKKIKIKKDKLAKLYLLEDTKPNQNDPTSNKGNLDNFPKLPLGKKKKEHNRRKPLPEPYQMDLNGEMVDVVTYDGFPIMLEDAKRLEELKKSLFAKGISNGEIKKIMKLQRRSAEKALTRARKKVCFNCRRSGHPLSECPSLNQGEGTGICFKCGSTEHTHFECKVVKKQEYKFAQCFICKEQGHISNQCPDNPRGLYPKGGACKLCGDVTHLKRFCPTLPKESEPTIGNFLGDEDTRQKRFVIKADAKPNKIVRF